MSKSSPGKKRASAPSRIAIWTGSVLMAAVLIFTGYLALPMVFGTQAGSSGQVTPEGFPSSVTATGEDGRTRTLSASAESGAEIDLSSVTPGDRVVVSGSGFNADSGIYVAVCKVPDSPEIKPGPCLGGVPTLEAGEESPPGSIDWAPANWINEDWAWKLFGARSFDDIDAGEFAAYVLIPESSDAHVDCTVEQCGIFTRNDHTELDNRVQDLYLPVSFAK